MVSLEGGGPSYTTGGGVDGQTGGLVKVSNLSLFRGEPTTACATPPTMGQTPPPRAAGGSYLRPRGEV